MIPLCHHKHDRPGLYRSHHYYIDKRSFGAFGAGATLNYSFGTTANPGDGFGDFTEDGDDANGYSNGNDTLYTVHALIGTIFYMAKPSHPTQITPVDLWIGFPWLDVR